MGADRAAIQTPREAAPRHDTPVAVPPLVNVRAPREASADEPEPEGAQRLLEWFGVELDETSLRLDRDRLCLDPGCRRHTLAGELLCPVHLDLLTPTEMPDPATWAARRGRRLLLAGVRAAIFVLMGLCIGLIVGDVRFGWLGGTAAGSSLAGFGARELRFLRLGNLLALAGFFCAVVLTISGLLVGLIAAI